LVDKDEDEHQNTDCDSNSDADWYYHDNAWKNSSIDGFCPCDINLNVNIVKNYNARNKPHTHNHLNAMEFWSSTIHTWRI